MAKKQKRWNVNFFDKNGTEYRTVTVLASNEDEAEDKAVKYAEENKWPASFKVGDAVLSTAQ
jgi:hypothetical protein